MIPFFVAEMVDNLTDSQTKVDYSTVTVMLCMPRSGGSLLNRCLGVLPDTIVMSEVSPNVSSGKHSVAYQAKEWYDIELAGKTYVDQVEELFDHCKKHKKKLIIRDHTYLNFFEGGGKFIYQKNDDLNVLVALKERIPFNTFAFVRDPIDSWVSHSGETEHIKGFFLGIENLLDLLDQYDVRIFKYEDFTENPEALLQSLCEHCGIAYSDAFLEQKGFGNYLGDINNRGRGLKHAKIVNLPRRLIHPMKIGSVNRSEEMKRVNKRLGYPIGYFGRETEGLNMSHVKRLFKKIGGK